MSWGTPAEKLAHLLQKSETFKNDVPEHCEVFVKPDHVMIEMHSAAGWRINIRDDMSHTEAIAEVRRGLVHCLSGMSSLYMANSADLNELARKLRGKP